MLAADLSHRPCSMGNNFRHDTMPWRVISGSSSFQNEMGWQKIVVTACIEIDLLEILSLTRFLIVMINRVHSVWNKKETETCTVSLASKQCLFLVTCLDTDVTSKRWQEQRQIGNCDAWWKARKRVFFFGKVGNYTRTLLSYLVWYMSCPQEISIFESLIKLWFVCLIPLS